MTPKQRIINLIRNEYNRSLENYRLLSAECGGIIAAHNSWKEFNEGDGLCGVSKNPYDITKAENKKNDARLYYEQMKAAYEIAIDTFLEEGD